MGVTSILVVCVAASLGILVSLALFRVGPRSLKSVFFLPAGGWRRFGRAAWLAAMVALLWVGLLVTPRYPA